MGSSQFSNNGWLGWPLAAGRDRLGKLPGGLIVFSEREVELCVLDSESGRSVTVTLPFFTPEWEQSRCVLAEWENGGWNRAR